MEQTNNKPDETPYSVLDTYLDETTTTVKEFCEIIRMTPSAVKHWKSKGSIPYWVALVIEQKRALQSNQQDSTVIISGKKESVAMITDIAGKFMLTTNPLN